MVYLNQYLKTKNKKILSFKDTKTSSTFEKNTSSNSIVPKFLARYYF